MEENIIAGVICVFNDVTEEFNLDRSRKKFVAEVSHELKTPLTTIGTYTETLLDNYPVGEEMEISFLKTILHVQAPILQNHLRTVYRLANHGLEFHHLHGQHFQY